MEIMLSLLVGSTVGLVWILCFYVGILIGKALRGGQ